MRVKYQYNLILYFLIALSILALAFLTMSYNKEISYNLKTLKAELVLYNDTAYKSILANTPYDSIPAPSKIRFTILDTGMVVLYDNFNANLTKDTIQRKELSLASQYGAATVFRKSISMESDFLFYAKKYENMYVRTGIMCKDDVIRLVENEQRYMYLIALLFIILAGAVFYDTQAYPPH